MESSARGMCVWPVTCASEFLHFSNYWYFDELANKEEEFEHFILHCRALRIQPVKNEVDEEIEKLNTSTSELCRFTEHGSGQPAGYFEPPDLAPAPF